MPEKKMLRINKAICNYAWIRIKQDVFHDDNNNKLCRRRYLRLRMTRT